MNYSSLRVGTTTGTLLSILGTVTWVDMERTLVLGGIGAAVSFLVSLLLKKITDYGTRTKKRKGACGTRERVSSSTKDAEA